jgi:L-asparaginase
MRKILIITTGGTIAMKKGVNGLALPAVSGEDFVEALPELKSVGEIYALSWKNVPSTHLDFADILELSRILSEYQQQGFAGAVITHGTDTIEETAYLLDLVANFEMGVVITGAQRNPSLPGADGPANLLDAAIIAASPIAAKSGVLVVFNGEAHTARDVCKTHTSRLDTFQSPEFGPLAVVTNMQAHWCRQSLIREHYDVAEMGKQVEIVKCTFAGDGMFLGLLLKEGVDGLVIEGLGAGHVTPGMMQRVRKAVATGIPVVLSSRCFGRLFTNTYGFAGSEKELLDTGVIFGDALPSIKARVKLAVLLAACLKPEEIREHFHKHFYRDV